MKRLASILLTLCLLVGVAPPWVHAAVVASGNCGANGDNVTWTLDDAGTLTISGSGAMADYVHDTDDNSHAPWYNSSDNIKSVIIQNGVTSIGNYAFEICFPLASITIPDSVTSIGDGAFYLCSSLKSITIPNSVTHIGYYTFYLSGLTDVNYSGTQAQWNAITIDTTGNGNSSLTNATIHCTDGDITGGSNTEPSTEPSYEIIIPMPDQVTETVVEPEKFQLVSKGSYDEFQDLYVDDEKKIRDVDYQALPYNVDGTVTGTQILAKTITLSKGTHTIVLAFTHKDTLGNTGTRFASQNVNVTSATPSPDEGKEAHTVTFDENGGGGFMNAVTVSGGTYTLPENGFSAPYGMRFSAWAVGNGEYPPNTTIPLSDDLTVMALWEPDPTPLAQGYCGADGDGTNLSWTLSRDWNLTISGTGVMKSYDESTRAPWYGYHTNISAATLEEGVTSIGNAAFTYCAALDEVTLPDTLLSIGDNAFFNCAALEEIELPAGLVTIGNSAFYGCEALAEIALPSGVTSMGNYTFAHCGSLETVSLPATLTRVGLYAFYDCGSLRGVSVPSGVTVLDVGAFNGCEALRTVSFPASLTGINASVFEGCESLYSQSYAGTVSQFEQIAMTLGAGNDELKEHVVHCSDGDYDWTPPDPYRILDNLQNMDEFQDQVWHLAGPLSEFENLSIDDVLLTRRDILVYDGMDYTAEEGNGASILAVVLNETDLGSVKNRDVGNLEYENGSAIHYRNLDEAKEAATELNKTATGTEFFAETEMDGSFTVHEYVPTVYTKIEDALHDLDEIKKGNHKHITLDESTRYDLRIIESNGHYEIHLFEIFRGEEQSTTKLKIPAKTFQTFGEGSHTAAAEFDNAATGTETRKQMYTVFPKPGTAKISLREMMGVTGVERVSYNGRFLSDPPLGDGLYRFALISGDIPPGLTLQDGGYFTGVARTAGSYHFEVGLQVKRDGVWPSGYEDTAQMTITIERGTVEQIKVVSDPGYEIVKPVADQITEDTEVVMEPENFTLVSNGPYEEFKDLYIDTELKIRDVDYEVLPYDESVSLKVGSAATQTYIVGKNLSVSAGTHTLSLEFERKDNLGNSKIHKAAQTFSVKKRGSGGDDYSSGSISGGGGGGGSGTSYYTITKKKADNGSIKLNKSSAAPGTTVTITPTPNKGYQLDKITVTASNKKNVPVSASNGVYSFSMPSRRVTVSADFIKSAVAATPKATASVAPTEHGSVQLSSASPAPGGVVTVYTTPQAGYQVMGVTASVSGKGGIKVENVGDNVFKFVMPSGGVTVNATFTPKRLAFFTDIQGPDWFFNDAEWAYNRGIILGVTEQIWQPQKEISGVTAIVTLERLDGVNLAPYYNGASDGLENTWYVAAARWARTNGIFPTNWAITDELPLTRGEYAILLYNFARYRGLNVSAPASMVFSDAALLSEAEYNAFRFLQSVGVFQGYEDGTIQPRTRLSRAQLCALLHRFSEYIISVEDSHTQI